MARRLIVERTERRNASRVRARSLVALQMTMSSSRARLDAAQFWQAHARKRFSSASSSHGSVAWKTRCAFALPFFSCESRVNLLGRVQPVLLAQLASQRGCAGAPTFLEAHRKSSALHTRGWCLVLEPELRVDEFLVRTAVRAHEGFDVLDGLVQRGSKATLDALARSPDAL